MKKTLNKLLKQIPLMPEVGQQIFQHLKKVVDQKKLIEEYCVLMFRNI
jgi:hypothetical protein